MARKVIELKTDGRLGNSTATILETTDTSVAATADKIVVAGSDGRISQNWLPDSILASGIVATTSGTQAQLFMTRTSSDVTETPAVGYNTIPNMSIEIPASSVNRFAVTDFSVVLIASVYRRFYLCLDGVKYYPDGVSIIPPSIRSDTGNLHVSAGGVFVAIPGDSAVHTISVAYEAETNYSSTTFIDRSMSVLIVASGTFPINIGGPGTNVTISGDGSSLSVTAGATTVSGVTNLQLVGGTLTSGGTGIAIYTEIAGGGGSGGGSSLTVSEVDGSPSVIVSGLYFPNGMVTDNGNGTATVGQLDANIAIQDWIPLTMNSPWINYGGGYTDAAYYKDPLGVVHLKGLIKNGALGTIANLPVGYRPSERLVINAVNYDTQARFDVTATGDIIWVAGGVSGTGIWLSLDGISFTASGISTAILSANTPYIHCVDSKAPDTAGGTFTAGAWRMRDLTLKKADTHDLAVLSSNQITLQPGTYRTYIRAPGYTVYGHQARLYNVTTGATILDGSQTRNEPGVQTDSIINGLFTLNITSTLRIEHFCESSHATGFGIVSAAGWAPVEEIYTSAEFWRTSGLTGVTAVVQQPYIYILDSKASGTPGGTFTSGAWLTRDLTVERIDTGNYATLASNQITLQPGTYRAHITAHTFGVHRNQIRLYNVTSSTVLLTGTSAYSSQAYNSSDTSILVGQFTLTVASVLEIRHRCETTNATNGFGVPAGSAFTVDEEIYTTVELWRS